MTAFPYCRRQRLCVVPHWPFPGTCGFLPRRGRPAVEITAAQASEKRRWRRAEFEPPADCNGCLVGRDGKHL